MKQRSLITGHGSDFLVGCNGSYYGGLTPPYTRIFGRNVGATVAGALPGAYTVENRVQERNSKRVCITLRARFLNSPPR